MALVSAPGRSNLRLAPTPMVTLGPWPPGTSPHPATALIYLRHHIPDIVQPYLSERLRTWCHQLAILQAHGYTLDVTLTTAPPYDPSHPRRRRVIAIHCKTVGTRENSNHIGQLVAIDALTGDILLDIVIQPPGPIRFWRTKRTGLTPAIFTIYRAANRMVYSVVSAQTALFEFMDRDTVLIGHGLNKDLRVLGMMHSRIIDSQILASSAIAKILGTLPPAPVRMGELCRNFLRVQLVGDHCVEAAFAARKLIFWILAEEEREQMGRIWGQAYRGQLRGWAEWVARRIARARCEVGHGNRDLQH